MLPELFHWRSQGTLQDGLGILPVPLFCLFLACVLVLGLLFLELQLPSRFCFLLIVAILLVSPQRPKAWWLPEKNHALSSFLLHNVSSFATEIKRSESTLQIREFLCLIFCIVLPFSFWRGIEEARQLNFQECGIQHLFPLPSIFLALLKANLFLF